MRSFHEWVAKVCGVSSFGVRSSGNVAREKHLPVWYSFFSHVCMMSFAICFVGITRIGISSGSGKAGQMVGFWACFGGGFWWVVGGRFRESSRSQLRFREGSVRVEWSSWLSLGWVGGSF